MRRSEFFAPAPLSAVMVLALNDHLGKPLFHNAITGKLTDLALCFFAPLLLSALLRPLWRNDRRRLVGAALMVTGIYVLLELSGRADACLTAAVAMFGRPLGFGLQPFTRDASDLLALAMVPLAVWYGRRRVERTGAGPSRSLRALALSGTLLLLVAEESPPLCDRHSAPVTFRVSDGCGPPGIIVVSAELDRGDLTAANGGALLGAGRGQYHGGACPFRLDQGGWFLLADDCPEPTPDGASGDAGTAGATPGDAGLDASLPRDAASRSCRDEERRRCQAALEGAELWLTCTGAGPSCRAKLTVVSP
jgi:hypothetical protein